MKQHHNLLQLQHGSRRSFLFFHPWWAEVIFILVLTVMWSCPCVGTKQLHDSRDEQAYEFIKHVHITAPHVHLWGYSREPHVFRSWCHLDCCRRTAPQKRVEQQPGDAGHNSCHYFRWPLRNRREVCCWQYGWIRVPLACNVGAFLCHSHGGNMFHPILVLAAQWNTTKHHFFSCQRQRPTAKAALGDNTAMVTAFGVPFVHGARIACFGRAPSICSGAGDCASIWCGVSWPCVLTNRSIP